MKHINKQNQEPTSLSNWKDNDKMYKRRKAKWSRFSKKDKDLFKQDLIQEQGYICCYCEQKIELNDSHLEHILPQSLDTYSDLLFDYWNLLASCRLQWTKTTPEHCGKSKDNWYDEDLFISPLDPNCEDQFIYIEDGTIEGKTTQATKTIEILKLDIDNLEEMRRSAIAPFIYDEFTEEEITIAEAKELAKDYLKRNSDGSYNEFYTTIKYLFS